MKLKHLNVGFELKEISEEGQFSGYASVFNVIDAAKDVVKRGAFKRSLKEWKAKGRMPALLWQHDTRSPIGVYESMKEDDTGLYVEGQLALGTQQGKEAHELLRMKAISGLSIGYQVVDFKRDEKNDIYYLTDLELWEASLVTFPANERARVSAVKDALQSGTLPTERQFEEHLRDAGFSLKQAKTIIAAGYRGLATDRDDREEVNNRKLSPAFYRTVKTLGEATNGRTKGSA